MTEQPDPTEALVGFAGLLRAHGVRLTPTEIGHFQAAVGVLPAVDVEHLYWAGRACLAVLPEFVGAYNQDFAHYFLGLACTSSGDERASDEPIPSCGTDQAADQTTTTTGLNTAADSNSDETENQDGSGNAAASVEVLRLMPFNECSEEELGIVTALVRRMRTPPPERPDRRRVRGHRKEAIDLQMTVRRAMKTQADLLFPAWRHHRQSPRRVVMLLDVSRSMAAYSRLLLHFGYALVSTRRGVEVVCFGTRLTRVTGLLRSRRPARSMEAAAMSVLDWNGGTRIADAVGGLRSMRSVRDVLRGAVVVICSDGLETGDASELGQQLYLLRRTCHEIIWVNPLAGDERYQPISNGMQAALPFIDRLMAGDTLAALENVAVALEAPLPVRGCTRSGV